MQVLLGVLERKLFGDSTIYNVDNCVDRTRAARVRPVVLTPKRN